MFFFKVALGGRPNPCASGTSDVSWRNLVPRSLSRPITLPSTVGRFRVQIGAVVPGCAIVVVPRCDEGVVRGGGGSRLRGILRSVDMAAAKDRIENHQRSDGDGDYEACADGNRRGSRRQSLGDVAVVIGVGAIHLRAAALPPIYVATALAPDVLLAGSRVDRFKSARKNAWIARGGPSGARFFVPGAAV